MAPPMTTNTSLRLSDHGSLLRVLIDGVPGQRYSGGEVMQEMPGFIDTLSNQELIDLTNFMTTEWGGQRPSVKLEQVEKLTQEGER